jgi:hypothetical protein
MKPGIKLWLVPVLYFLSMSFGFAQDLVYARKIVKELCSDEYAGRGYVKSGDALAANFIRLKMKEAGLKPVGTSYYQEFGFPVITFPEIVELNIDGEYIFPGKDFLVNPGCPSINGTFSVLEIDSTTLDNNTQFEKLKNKNLRNYFLIVDHIKDYKLIHPERADLILKNELKAKGLLYKEKPTLTWSVAMEFAPFPIISIQKDRIKQLILKMKVRVESSLSYHATQNVIGMIKGKEKPDSFLVVTAHYDHLGKMGDFAIFPGANDNASGVAMMLDLAKTFSKKPPKYSVLFIAFAGEEAGLLGSLYYTENPVLPLSKIKFLLNLDLMATGDKGLTAVNGTVHTELFDLLKTCNSIGSYLPAINARGKAANSDHYYFSEKGVPAMFIYLMGDYHQYHDVGDTYEAITFSKYNEAFLLMKEFLETID